MSDNIRDGGDRKLLSEFCENELHLQQTGNKESNRHRRQTTKSAQPQNSGNSGEP